MRGVGCSEGCNEGVNYWGGGWGAVGSYRGGCC